MKIKILANRYVDNVICVSDHIKELSIRRGYNKDKCIVVYNGIDINKNTHEYDEYDIRSELKIPIDKKVILAYGYNPIIKGIDILLDAFKDQKEDMYLVLVGREELENYILNHEHYEDMKDNILLIKPMEHIGKLVNVVDVFISSSRTEGFSYSIGEAMLNKKIAIVSNIKGTEHYLNSKGVLSYQFDNCLDLSARLNEFRLLTKEEREYLGDINRVFVTDNFSLSKWVKEIIDIYSM